MRRLIKSAFFLLLISITITGCYAEKRNMSELGGLMLLDHTYLSRNKAFYSRRNKRLKKNVHNNHKKVARENKKITSVKYR